MITLLGLLCLIYLFTTGATPIELIKLKLKLSNDSIIENKYWALLREFLCCSMCVGFWVGLIFYQSIFMAGIVSIAAEVLTRLMTKI